MPPASVRMPNETEPVTVPFGIEVSPAQSKAGGTNVTPTGLRRTVGSPLGDRPGRSIFKSSRMEQGALGSTCTVHSSIGVLAWSLTVIWKLQLSGVVRLDATGAPV